MLVFLLSHILLDADFHSRVQAARPRKQNAYHESLEVWPPPLGQAIPNLPIPFVGFIGAAQRS